ncbi:EAL domain-containing protein [Pararobbsia silviterrae]|uniref:EAL domain-containing protein n=1 Tax=Pararobbsia silviterrae TaxID=1792498 RepID=UPI001314294A|nr:EAL domain-containing protein [Pararobbsia silviterrae]
MKSQTSDLAASAAHGSARRSRTLFTIACALATFVVFIALGAWQARLELNARRSDVAHDVISSIESMVDRVSSEHGRLVRLAGMPCDVARIELETSETFIPYIRSAALVKDGVIYCSSSFGPNTVHLSTYLGEFRRDGPSYRLVPGTVAHPGRATLLVFFPSTTPDPLGAGVLFYIDGVYLSDVLRDDSHLGMDRIVLRNGRAALTLDGMTSNVDAEPPTLSSSRYPIDVVVDAAPSLTRSVYRRQLVIFGPIGLAFAALLAWLMANSLAPRRLLLRAVRTGLARGEFEVRYQPVIDLANGACIGIEALVRWAHPRWGDVGPAAFIGIVENDPLIVPMTHSLVERALDDLHTHRVPPHLHLAINLSPRHLQNRQGVNELTRLLRTHARGRGVIAEVTERQLFDDRRAALASFEQLRAIGVRFALDDFGTDRNTLSPLQAFHFDFLKIDQGFVAELEYGRTDLVRGIVALARQIGLTVIAEGIESTRQHERLLELGVEFGQGYLHGYPMTAARLARWLVAEPRGDGGDGGDGLDTSSPTDERTVQPDSAASGEASATSTSTSTSTTSIPSDAARRRAHDA